MKKLIKILSTYVASKCFKKLLSTEEVDYFTMKSILSKVDTVSYKRWIRHKGIKIHMIFSGRDDDRRNSIISHLGLENRENSTIRYFFKKYSINADMILCTIEVRSNGIIQYASSTSNYDNVYEFQWVQ